MAQNPPPGTGPVIIQQTTDDPNWVIRIIWYILVGWWLSAIMITVGWFLMVTIVFLPVGLWILHRVPWAQTLRPRSVEFHSEYRDGAVYMTQSEIPQYPWFVRLVYIVFVGWWLGAIWLLVAWLLGALLVTLPLSIIMIDRSPALVSLQRN